jgi:hypothetical protein
MGRSLFVTHYICNSLTSRTRNRARGPDLAELLQVMSCDGNRKAASGLSPAGGPPCDAPISWLLPRRELCS